MNLNREKRSDLLPLLWNYTKDCFRIETRSLAVFRIILGVLIVVDVLLRSRNFYYFYTDEGVFPQSVATDLLTDTAYVEWSPYFFSSEPAFTALLFAVTALVGVMLALGYRTRLAVILAFLLVVSLDRRNTVVMSNADLVFRLLLFWGIFLPLGERWSVDAVHRERDPRSSVVSIASAFVLLQVVFIYFRNGFHKTDSELWWSGEAAIIVFGLDEITFLLGDYMLAFPILVQYGGAAWFYMLLASPLILLIRGRLRVAFALLFIAVHASFAVTVRIGAFPYVSIAGVVLFLGARFWDDVGAVHRLVVPDLSPPSPLRFLANALPDLSVAYDLSSIRQATHRLCMVAIVFGLLTFSIFSYTPVGDLTGDTVSPEEQIETVALSLGIDQPSWQIFAPRPPTSNRYYVFPARTADGEIIDIYNDREFTFDRPYEWGSLHLQYDTYRERFYMNGVRRTIGGDYEGMAERLAEQICDEYSEDGTELTHVNMYQVVEDVTVETARDHTSRDTRISDMYRHGCGDNEAMEIR